MPEVRQIAPELTDGTTITDASNQFVIVLQRAPGHKPGGYYVHTGYPA